MTMADKLMLIPNVTKKSYRKSRLSVVVRPFIPTNFIQQCLALFWFQKMAVPSRSLISDKLIIHV